MKMIETSKVVTVGVPAQQIEDRAIVQIGALSPSFPPVHAPPVEVRDRGDVEMGALSPAFPPVRTA
jgi:hypothetical protein